MSVTFVYASLTITPTCTAPEQVISFRLVRSELVVTLMEGAISSSPSARIAVVTGGNKGIGLEVCRHLAGNGVSVVLTARDEKRGMAAVEKLKGLGLSHVIFYQLEITDASSISRLADFVKARFGRLDVLVNNAAFGGVEYAQDPISSSVAIEDELSGMDGVQRLEWLWRNCRETYDAAKKGLQTNYYGTKHVIEALLPLLQASSDGRIVNVYSGFGLLRFFRNEELKQDRRGHRREQRDRTRGVPATGRQWRHRRPDSPGRDEGRGGRREAQWTEAQDVTFHQLDVTDASSIARLADFLRSRFGRLDILVNNAAIGGVELVGDPSFGPEFTAMDGQQRLEFLNKRLRETNDGAKECLQTNYYGPKHVIEALLPLLKSSSERRIVNVSSDCAQLRLFGNEELKQELDDVERLNEERLDELLGTFLKDFEAGAVEARGWPLVLSAYKVAKAVYSRVLARRHPALRVNCVDPAS